MNNLPNNESVPRPRREVILGGLAVLMTMALAYNPFKKSPEKKQEKVKMLTEDGRLVEIDVAATPVLRKRKVSNDELKEWGKEK